MTTWFVSPTGNNNNPGSIEQPFKTINKCANMAEPGDTCLIREGVYSEWVQPKNSGNENAPITFEAYNEEQVILSGAQTIEGEWQEHENGIYKIKLDKNQIRDLGVGQNQLFVDGEMMIEARWSNIDNAVDLTRDNHIISSDGGFLEDSAPSSKDGYSKVSAYYESPELEQFSEGFWDDAYISFIPGHEWWGNAGTITKSTPGRIEFEFDFPSGWENFHQPSADDPFYIWGSYNALDAEKEWFFDTTGLEGDPYTLYFKAPGGTLENKTIQLKRRNQIFNLNDRSHIHVKNIEFFGSRIAMNSNSSYNIFDRITSEYAGHNQGISGWIAPPPIDIQGNNHQLINSRLGNTAGALTIAGNDHTIENNVFHDFGYVAASVSGIQAKGNPYNIKISQNTIFNSGEIGISANFKSSEITHNHIWNIGKQKTDIAAINGYNAGDVKGTEIAYNLIHDVWSYNDTAPHWGGYGIRFDGGGAPLGNSNYNVHNNTIFNTSSSSIGVWGIPDTGDNYNETLINIENNTVDGTILLAEANKSHAGTKLLNNISNELKTVGHQKKVSKSRPYIPDEVIVKDNLFLHDLENNFSWQDADFPDNESLPSNLFPLNDLGKVSLPFTSSSINIDSQTIGAEKFIPGALLLEEDLSNLVGIFQEKNNENNSQQLMITGLPLGRVLPENVSIKLGEITQTANCWNLIDLDGHTTSICDLNQVDISEQHHSIYLSLNGGSFMEINQGYKKVSEPSTVVCLFVFGIIFLSKIFSHHGLKSSRRNTDCRG
ncbi:MAG: DUF1565 domain-containing protein [Trichodesmium sp. MAG_R03]|nr:DUF1565 domain-containing protein [Trichodesmium sp. MAG_R03]